MLKISAITMNSRCHKEKNIQQAISYIKQAKKLGSDWIALPEMFSYMGPYEHLPQVAEKEDGPLNHLLSNLAKELQITLFAGSAPEATTTEKVYNTTYIFSPDGSILAKYRKTHLFELHSHSKSQQYQESDGYLSGTSPTTFQHQGLRIGLGICFDIRFGEYFTKLNQNAPCDVFFFPSAFTEQTGQDHWNILVQSRAIEFQAFMIATNQTGESYDKKTSYGHSMLVNPWGDILAQTTQEAGIATSIFDPMDLHRFRKKLPIRECRRIDLYTADA